MTDIPKRLRRAVIERAKNRCEYCKLSQTGQEATFHIDHVMPRAKDGRTILENLALACVSCSLRKSSQTVAKDPASGVETPLFDPRRHIWSDHFEWHQVEIRPKTAIGRVTVKVLLLNRVLILDIRREEQARGRHPPTG
jgi:hypothetical protein